jgi:hypothetical protein
MTEFILSALGAAIISAVVLVVGIRWFQIKPPASSSDETRTEWSDYLKLNPEASDVNDSTTTDFLITETKYLIMNKIDCIKSIESKASSQASIVGGGLGFLSILGGVQPQLISGKLSLFIISGGILLLLTSTSA